ncbi:DoxX family protein [Foetidibacter luteolus]|uniref:DoxX family protein n=1 Tax=Foetidibacter luteolus TaxID=2608880 RepID=UPI00129A4620|nr:DoxX family protein [Foetidibacter luteolus]
MKPGKSPFGRYRKRPVSLYIMSALYVLAGLNHFINTDAYLSMMPPYLPWHKSLIYLSGTLEISFGLLLIPYSTRRFAALGIIFLLITVFPANIQVMLNYMDHHSPYTWLTVVRLFLQLGLIWWAYQYHKRPLKTYKGFDITRQRLEINQ